MPSDTTELEALAVRLEASPDFRVLRAVAPPERLDALPDGARVGVYLDLETTGLDHRADRVIELGLVRFAYDLDNGTVLGMLDDYSGLEDPGRPLPPEITRLTGIDDAMLAGQRIDDGRVQALLEGASVVIAHNARFDRPFAEARLPAFADVHWACSLRDVAWRDEGFESSGLQALVMASGGFFEGHRAVEDCYAGVYLLARPLPRSGERALAALRRNALRRDVRVWAVGSPFDTKDLLKARGYRWNPDARVWWCDVPEDALDEELAWLRDQVYAGRLPRLPHLSYDARSRYSLRVAEAPT
ncbi:MAG: 3'-5' exonuclease [Trueperaceae bacterium]|nr:MAG: 3'-5' exonuclease [Trueperaceae bacterium]